MATNTHAIFEKGIMASTQLDHLLRNVQAHADLDNGAIVTAASLVSGEEDLYTSAAPTDVTADVMYIVDAPKRTLINDKYALDEIKDPREFYTVSGKSARVRKPQVGDTCYLSAAGFASTPTVGQYAVPANGALTLAPAANLSGSTTIAFKVVKAHTFYVGSESVTGYRLECVVA
jgi:hypothetical protein